MKEPCEVGCVLKTEVARKPQLEWTNVWSVAIRALGKNFLVEDHRVSLDQDGLLVTHVTRNFGVPALKRKMCPLIVIEGRGCPAIRIVAINAGSLTNFCKLARVGVFVTILANL